MFSSRLLFPLEREKRIVPSAANSCNSLKVLELGAPFLERVDQCVVIEPPRHRPMSRASRIRPENRAAAIRPSIVARFSELFRRQETPHLADTDFNPLIGGRETSVGIGK